MTHLVLAAAESHNVAALLTALAVMLGSARLLGELARRYGQPAILGELLAGIVLGPTVLGYVWPAAHAYLFIDHPNAVRVLHGIVTLSATLLLLVAGLEVDLSTVFRRGKAALIVSLGGVALPLVLGMAMALALPATLGQPASAPTLPFALFLGISMAITAVPVIAKILLDLNLFQSDVGVIIMAAAILNDLVGWIGFAVVMALIGDHSTNIGLTVAMTLVFTVLMLTLGRAILHRLIPFVQAHASWPGGVIAFVIVVALAGAAVTEQLGIHAIFGALMAGIALGDSSHLRERTRDTISQFVMSFFAPLFFASIGLRVDFIRSFDLPLVLLVTAVAVVGKLFGCYAGARLAKLGKRESWAIGCGMCARGAMEIVLAQAGLQLGLIDDRLFVAIVIMALATSFASGPLIQWILQRRQRRALHELLSERQFIPQMNSTSSADAIAELGAVAASAASLPPDRVIQAVWEREQLLNTGLPGGVAVPHARMPGLTRSIVVVGRSTQGVDFNAPDGSPARIICLLLTPQSDENAQVELLAAVAESFYDPNRVKQAAEARSFTEFVVVLKLPVEARDPRAEPAA